METQRREMSATYPVPDLKTVTQTINSDAATRRSTAKNPPSPRTPMEMIVVIGHAGHDESTVRPKGRLKRADQAPRSALNTTHVRKRGVHARRRV